MKQADSTRFGATRLAATTTITDRSRAHTEMDSTLSAYELQRLDNIARNKEVLTSLGLQAVVTPAAPKRSKPKAARPPTAPSRKSGRLASVPAPSVYVDSERSNGMVMLGGADAAEVAATSARGDLVAAAETAPTDEDPAPDAEEQLFPSEAKARALAASLILTQLTRSLTCHPHPHLHPHLTLTFTQVYAELRAEKNSIARELETAAYHVAQNRALMSMARAVPASLEELLGCWGWGEAKVAAHGARLLAVLRPHTAALLDAKARRARRASDDDEDADATDTDDAGDAEGEDAPLSLRRGRSAGAEASRASRVASVGGAKEDAPLSLRRERAAAAADARAAAAAATVAAVAAGQEREVIEIDSDEEEAEARAVGAVAGAKRRRAGGATEARPRRRPVATGAASTADAAGAAERGGGWRDAAGEALASEAWRAQRRVAAASHPACAWAARRRRCARVHGCEACARYVGDGRPWSYAPLSQRMLDLLASPGAYGSHAAAHAAGWRWNASPNHGQSSHAHQWWPPQAAVEAMAGAKLPLGTCKALALIDELF